MAGLIGLLLQYRRNRQLADMYMKDHLEAQADKAERRRLAGEDGTMNPNQFAASLDTGLRFPDPPKPIPPTRSRKR
jgi:hypothetical protein